MLIHGSVIMKENDCHSAQCFHIVFAEFAKGVKNLPWQREYRKE